MKFLIPDATGHTTLTFSKSKAGIKEAMEKFNELVKGEKKVAYTRNAAGKTAHVRQMDPSADETVFFNPLAGG
jgi:hypothetical protein